MGRYSKSGGQLRKHNEIRPFNNEAYTVFYRAESVRSDTLKTQELETQWDGQLQTTGALEAKETIAIPNKSKKHIYIIAGRQKQRFDTGQSSIIHTRLKLKQLN